jgi:hypothetical protein
MTSTDLTKPSASSLQRTPDIFNAMREEMERIESAVWAAPGVTGVVDQLRVTS